MITIANGDKIEVANSYGTMIYIIDHYTLFDNQIQNCSAILLMKEKNNILRKSRFTLNLSLESRRCRRYYDSTCTEFKLLIKGKHTRQTYMRVENFRS